MIRKKKVFIMARCLYLSALNEFASNGAKVRSGTKWKFSNGPVYLRFGMFDPVAEGNEIYFKMCKFIFPGNKRVLCLQRVDVPTHMRRQGNCTQLLRDMESAARQHGLEGVYVQSVISPEMYQLMEKQDGYICFFENNYLKLLQ